MTGLIFITLFVEIFVIVLGPPSTSQPTSQLVLFTLYCLVIMLLVSSITPAIIFTSANVEITKTIPSTTQALTHYTPEYVETIDIDPGSSNSRFTKHSDPIPPPPTFPLNAQMKIAKSPLFPEVMPK